MTLCDCSFPGSVKYNEVEISSFNTSADKVTVTITKLYVPSSFKLASVRRGWLAIRAVANPTYQYRMFLCERGR
jgi:hypothetical protein